MPPSESQWELSVEDGDVTAERMPTFSGKTEANSTVIIYNNGVEFGRAIVDAQGNWTFTPNEPLADGNYSFTTVVVDQAGNAGPESDSIEFTVEGVPESDKPVIDGIIDGDSGAVIEGGQTNSNSPTFRGIGLQPGETVHVYDGRNIIGSASVAADGSWSFTPGTLLEDGAHSFSIVVESVDGKLSEPSDPWNIVIDTTLPIAMVVIDAVSKTSLSEVSGTLVSNDGSAGRLVQGKYNAPLAADEKIQVSTDGGVTWSDALVSDDFTWSFVDYTAHT
ncbi:Ig-like domain-containing protein, partial [Pseudomonas serboccidentalis]|uniref:Ig-like domain-containing protein n=1 Tax=Pseudomonas serboccidentalis TaxID=2964670 RepID=UPI0039DFB749